MKMLTKEEAAAELADYDFQIDEGLRAVYRIMADNEDDPEEPLKLLKVNADTPENGIMPLHFPPDTANGIPFAYELVVITPHEFDRLRSADLRLPDACRTPGGSAFRSILRFITLALYLRLPHEHPSDVATRLRASSQGGPGCL